MNRDVMFSSKNEVWATPDWLFNQLNDEFNFDIDVCANNENAKCKKYFTINENGLKQEWNGTCWMNPPYGRNINKWMKKAYNESLKGNTVVCLIPCRTDTKYWHKYVMKATEIRFIEGRLKFGDSKNAAPFPSAIVIFNNKIGFNVVAYERKKDIRIIRLRKK